MFEENSEHGRTSESGKTYRYTFADLTSGDLIEPFQTKASGQLQSYIYACKAIEDMARSSSLGTVVES